MSFEEITDRSLETEDGLPLAWYALEGDCCPRCLLPMALFEDIQLWKCTCGFKIGDERKNDIESGTSGRSSFGLGNYEDEPPFGGDRI